MGLHVAYYSTTFIIALFLLGRVLSIRDGFEDGREDIRRNFAIYCIGFFAWSMCVVIVGVSPNTNLDKIFLLIGEFFRFFIFIVGAELFASITDTSLTKKMTLVSISSQLLYLAIATLAIILFVERAATNDGVIGTYFVKNTAIGLLLYIFFHVVVLFFYSAYTYMYMYTCSKKRDYYISKQCAYIVVILVVCLSIESFFYAKAGEFVPVMYVGMLLSIYFLYRLIVYKRSIEYNEADYQRILAPAYTKPAFVCDDEGRIIFANTRAFVMQQTYKDTYKGKFLADIFDITDYDRERLSNPKLTQSFEILCKYPLHSLEIMFSVKHNIDKYGCIFSTEIELESIGDYSFKDKEEDVESQKEDTYDARKALSANAISDIRTEHLLKQIEYQKAFFENRNESLFMMNMKGLSKSASVLGLPALEELCNRIQTELSYGEWEGLSSMIIELDRQYESLKLFQDK